MKKIIYPWHEKAHNRIHAYRREQRFPHALLISGIAGLGKKTFTEQIARELLCAGPLSQAEDCQCFSCLLPDLNGHPDYKEISPLEESKVIKIEQIREITEFLSQTTHRTGNRVILIMPAEAMNMAAFNALLKTLEEPPVGTHFLLVSHAPAQLPATIRSRCQSIKISPTFEEATINWIVNEANITPQIAADFLHQAEGAPQQAITLITENLHQTQAQLEKDLIKAATQPAQLLHIAEAWQKKGFLMVLDQLIYFLEQEIKKRFYRTRETTPLQAITIEKLISFVDSLLELRKTILVNPNLNTQLLSEKLLFLWKGVASNALCNQMHC